MEEIRSLAHISLDELHAVWDDAFKGYERSWTKDELEVMLHRRGYVPALSFGAFDNGKLVSFTLNGIGNYNGIYTAYDSGTGTTEAYRGKGLATKIFEYSLPYLRDAGCTQYILEVLHYNEKAVSVYRNIGFTVARELNYFVQSMDKIALNEKQLSAEYELRPLTLDAKQEMIQFHDFHPSWQNSFEAIERIKQDLIILGAFKKDILVAYGMIEPGSGDITQLAVNKTGRRKGLASILLKELLKHNKHSSVKLINTERGNTAITSFAENNGIPNLGWQYEMTLPIAQ